MIILILAIAIILSPFLHLGLITIFRHKVDEELQLQITAVCTQNVIQLVPKLLGHPAHCGEILFLVQKLFCTVEFSVIWLDVASVQNIGNFQKTR